MPRRNNQPPQTARCHPDRKHVALGKCKSCYDIDYAASNRGARNAKARAWARRHPERHLAAKRKYLYGVDAATVQALLDKQGGLCAVCATNPARDVDHDHQTGEVRGMLCGDCNRGLGLFRDDAARLERAVAYLKLPNTGMRADAAEERAGMGINEDLDKAEKTMDDIAEGMRETTERSFTLMERQCEALERIAKALERIADEETAGYDIISVEGVERATVRLDQIMATMPADDGLMPTEDE